MGAPALGLASGFGSQAGQWADALRDRHRSAVIE